MAAKLACITTVNTEIANPDGTVHKLTFGTRIDENDGQLLESLLSKSGKLLRKERYQYVSRSDNQAGFSTKVGDNPKYLYDSIKSEYVLPQKKRLIEQDGTVFSKQVNAFDIFARPTDITRSSSLGFSKTELLTYHDNRNNWTIGQLASISDVTSGKIEAFRNFDPTSARITSQLEFGQLAGTYFWNSDGTLASVKDANNNATSFSNYYRGIPQRITHADASFETGVVNDNGWVTAMTDVLNNNNSFAYDLMGRLTAITPPTGDTVAWSSTAITFDKLLADIYGISSGAWKQTISKGNYRKEIYLDTQWRPILTREFDTANIAGTQRFTRQAYDSEGRVIFASYPGSTDVLALGVRTFYDGLGRVTKVEQDSELGVLTTTTQYLLGSKVQVTDPKGNQTTTTYQLLDDPETSMPVIIKSPEGITTTIVRDVFGKPLSTSRHGAQN